MAGTLDSLIRDAARNYPDRTALVHNRAALNYRELDSRVDRCANSLMAIGLSETRRVAICLPKSIDNVVAMFSASRAGAIFVPVNPRLKGAQASHILADCQANVLITNMARYESMAGERPDCLHTIVLVDADKSTIEQGGVSVLTWQDLLTRTCDARFPRILETDMAAFFYTSGSTGRPKGVVLSHRNLVLGARTVARYLDHTPQDRVLAVLPLSFDYGFSQVSVAFASGAACCLMTYLFPQDILARVQALGITGLSLVPPLWIRLAETRWPPGAMQTLRYYCNSGGTMPRATLSLLREKMPQADPFLMYGLTEAFRSCFLPPKLVDAKPGSFGRAIPNARIWVINDKGEACRPGEPGELVHAGPLVSMGYWNAPEETASRFRPAPGTPAGLARPVPAVWSGDIVTQDKDGFLYYVGRTDDLIKTSGYRVSPAEIEEVVYTSGLVSGAVALGVPHTRLGQAIVLVASLKKGAQKTDIQAHCQHHLPAFQQPRLIACDRVLPRNANGKFDRATLKKRYHTVFNNKEKNGDPRHLCQTQHQKQ